MEEETKKGILIGCLASVAAMFGLALGFLFLCGVLIKGCTEVVAGPDENAAMELGTQKPESEGEFTKVWAEGAGGRTAPKVLRIRLKGTISFSSAHSIWDVDDVSTAASALQKIRAAAKDESIKGLLIDIDSPGGGVTESDILHHAVLRFKEAHSNRFVCVQMGDMCCSGGYYVAVAADHIMARPTSLTGSIGVILDNVNFAGLARKLGVEPVTIASGANKDILNPLKPVRPEHLEILKRPIEHMYERFVGLVAKGRNLPVETVRKLADGRVYSAQDALHNKLVDSIGYREDMLEVLKRMAGGKNVRVVRYDDPFDLKRWISNSLFLSSGGAVLRSLKTTLESEPKVEYRLRDLSR